MSVNLVMKNCLPLRAEAANELLARRGARVSIASYLRYLNLGYEPAKHHRLLIEYLEAVERRDIPRLMVFLPPGSAKSTYASMIFPAWYLGKNPTHNVIAASHSTELAERFGRRVRGIYSTADHSKIFGNTVSKESSAAGRWSTSAGGEYFAAGVGTGISGFRSDCGLVDDPFRTREDADSGTIRDKVWDWYKADFFPRLKPNGVQILIMTRWHPDDLAGRLLNDEKDGGQKWHVVSVPMECVSADDLLERKIGERLWAEWFTEEMVEQAKRDSRNWASLYQQSPVVDGGHILRRDWWQKWDGKHPPECSYILQSWDTAYSESDLKTNSYSARTTWGVFKDRSDKPALILIEAWHGRVDYPDLRAEALKAYQQHKPDCVLIEKKASGQSLIQDLRRYGIPIATYQPDRDKVARAYAVQAMLESGQIYYPPRKWADDVISECEQFPHGANNDFVDTCTQAWLRVRNAGLLLLPDPVPVLESDIDPLFQRRELRVVRGFYG